MAALSFNLRNIRQEVMWLLKREATKQSTSVNSLIIQIIEQRMGVAPQPTKAVFHDLDHLAGTWSEEDEKAFDRNIKSFETIEEELWSETGPL